ncbi:MAG: oxidoreductase C-terminal domain-containing protein [Alphaproteobacteria bacterium]
MITGTKVPDEELPWFWSDQYELKLTIAGLFTGYDHIVQRGSMEEASFALFYYQGDRLLAVDAVNRPAEYLGAKQVIQRGRTIEPAALQDMSKSMKEIVAATR